MDRSLDAARLQQAFDLLGADLAARGAFVELAVYGGGAIMLQFAWRRSTEDVDAVVREGYDEAVLGPSVAHVATRMNLDPMWLNDAVGMFTPLDEQDTLFMLSGSYPAGAQPGLRTFVAKPHYLLAMKLQALQNLDRGDRDINDARMLASHLGLTDVAELDRLYRSIYDDAPPETARSRFAAVVEVSKP
ncbi:hypothetical protein [Methylobacterium planeticum]|uniref:Nucleotidyl transferase n=1 Tax=Methylobacterium planeticum TaxID=2615211 RepID=A0A6N6MTA2_9HYPH|nr:hypothetical protein [Methylobacterium planeticum]KAB1075108.1 hypothetical protein F6X51_04255 [Methylobacterium planeticum]